MSDASDAISKAMSMNKKLAASLLVRKQKLEEDIARGAPLRDELASVEQELSSAKREITELRRLAAKNGTLSASEIQAMADDDAFGIGMTAEDRALERARAGINDLEAEAGLAPERPAVAAAKPSREDADEKARQEFEALKAGPQKTKRTMGPG